MDPEDQKKLEFKKIRNILGKLLGYRIPEGGIATTMRMLQVRGEIMGKEWPVIIAILEYLDRKESQ